MPTVKGAVSAYLDHLQERQCRPVHLRSVRSRLGHFLDQFGDADLSALSRAQVGQHLSELEKERAEATMAGISATHRAFWRWCHEEGLAGENLGAKLRHYDYTPSVRTAAPPQHVEAVAAALPAYVAHRAGKQWHENDIRTALLVSLSLDSGARRGEMGALRVADVERSLERPTWTAEGEAYTVASRGKTGTATLVYFAYTASLFRRWFEVLEEQQPGARFVFVNLASGKRLDPNSLGRLFVRVCEFAGVPPFRSHAIRKRNITEMVDTAGMAAAQDYAGHKDIRTTRRHYYQSTQEKTVAAAAALHRRRRQSVEEAAELARLFQIRSEAE